jgi:hypothetical protein
MEDSLRRTRSQSINQEELRLGQQFMKGGKQTIKEEILKRFQSKQMAVSGCRGEKG